MTRTLVTFFLLVMLATSLATTQASARIRTLTADECRGTVHPVMYGETVEQLIGPVFRPNSRWPAFVRANEGVKDRFFIRRDGTLIVKLYPSRGDTICIPPETRVVGDIVATEPYELAGTGAGTPAPAIPQSIGWAILGFTAALIAAIYFWKTRKTAPDEEALLEEELSKDPVTSGKPYVAGGIEPAETRRLENFFDQRARALYRERNPEVERFTFHVDRIGPIQAGTISGEGFVGYLDSELKPRRIPEPGIRAYQAQYRFPDGTEEVLQTLQACMNPVHSGDTYKGFVFTEEKPIVSDEQCRGKGVVLDREEILAQQEKDFFGESMDARTMNVTERTILDAVGQVDELSLQQGGGHRAPRYQYTSRRRY